MKGFNPTTITTTKTVIVDKWKSGKCVHYKKLSIIEKEREKWFALFKKAYLIVKKGVFKESILKVKSIFLIADSHCKE